MSLYKDASLVMIPSAVKDGKLYSIRPTDGSGDFTFSRGSNLAATRVDVNGLIEKGRENLLLQSNQFDTTWSANGTFTITSGEAGYDGSDNAWKIVKDAVSFRYIYQDASLSGVQTFSVYAKADTLNQVTLYANASTNSYVKFSLVDGSILAESNAVDSKALSVGNDWWRLSITINEAITRVRIYPDFSEADGGSIYIQDSQLESSLVSTSVIETGASTAQAGILEDLPRLDYSGGASCPALLLEPQRTNVIPQSEYFGFWNTNGTASVTDNQAVSPEGVSNAALLDFGSTTLGANRIDLEPAISAGADYVFSVFVKNIDANRIGLRNYNTTKDAIASFDFSSGSFTDTNINIIDTIVEPYSNGWYRIGIVFNSGVDTTADVRISPDTTSGSDGEQIYIYGAQLEAASYPTSYIPTYGSAVTRSQDVADGTTIDTTANHTLIYDFDVTTGRETSSALFNIGYDNSNRYFIKGTSSSSPQFQVSGTGVFSGNINPTNEVSGRNKIAVQWIDGTGYVYSNGVKQSETLTNTSSANDIDYYKAEGRGYSHEVNQLLIFNTALTDSECIALTS